MDVLDEIVGVDLFATRVGGLAAYPAEQLGRIFAWAEETSRSIEWVEGVFFDPQSRIAQLSFDHTRERRMMPYDEFRRICLRLADEIAAAAVASRRKAYFEIGISS